MFNKDKLLKQGKTGLRRFGKKFWAACAAYPIVLGAVFMLGRCTSSISVW